MGKKEIVTLSVVFVVVSFFSVFLIITSFKYAYKKDISQKAQNVKTSSDILTEKQFKVVESSQVKFVKFYSNLKVSPDQKAKSLLALMAPLGVLDPIANPSKISEKDALLNYIFGAYSKEFGIPEEDVVKLAAISLTYANTFNEDEFFAENSEYLSNLVVLLSSYPELHVMGYWPNYTYRINNYFGDANLNLLWEVEDDGGLFYSYKEIHTASTSAPLIERRYAIKDYGPLTQVMAALSVETIYKCEDKTILVINGVVDNAFGLIYNAKSAESVNCGLFEDRFNIIYDKPLSNKWRYWVAN